MSRNTGFLAAVLCLAVCAPASLSAKVVSYWYVPHYLAKVEDASNRLQFLSPHFAPGNPYGLPNPNTSTYTLTKASESNLGLNFFFTESGVETKSPGLLSLTTVKVPYKKDSVVSIVYADILYFAIWNVTSGSSATPWCIAPAVNGDSNDNILCVPTQKDAQQLVDAIATLAVACGTAPHTPFGMGLRAMTEKELRKHPEQSGCQVVRVDSDGPAAQAGVREGDILRTANGKPCTGEALSAAIDEATAKPDGAIVRAEILRRGNPMALDLRYPHVEVDAAALRQQIADLAQQTAPTSAAPSSGAAAARGGFHLGISVRPVMESDLAATGMAKPQGVLVTNIEKGSLAEQMQIEIGDAITAVNGANVVDADAFAQIVRSGAAKRFHVLRKGQALDLMLSQSM